MLVSPLLLSVLPDYSVSEADVVDLLLSALDAEDNPPVLPTDEASLVAVVLA